MDGPRFWAFAQGEPRVTGLIPWHWGDLGARFKIVGLGCVVALYYRPSTPESLT